jgi:hypothetical protein
MLLNTREQRTPADPRLNSAVSLFGLAKEPMLETSNFDGRGSIFAGQWVWSSQCPNRSLIPLSSAMRGAHREPLSFFQIGWTRVGRRTRVKDIAPVIPRALAHANFAFLH